MTISFQMNFVVLLFTSLTVIVNVGAINGFFKPNNPCNHENCTTLLYVESLDGHILLDVFIDNSDPTLPKVNPINRARSCSHVDVGRYPVYGFCSLYLECTTAVKKLFQCPPGLWFRPETKQCEIVKKKSVCAVGYPIQNPPNVQEIINSCGNLSEELKIHNTVPDCTGYFTCRKVKRGIERYTYSCGEHLWNGYKCVPTNKHNCTQKTRNHDCMRQCVPGDVRTCNYNFIVQESAAMSVHCKDCPFTSSDCHASGCIPGGGVKRSILTINGMMPGPEIHVCKGDRIVVRVQNKLHAEGLTIHWHGLHMIGTPHMDGVPHITQCPINPMRNFTYEFLAEQDGTHLYHSHVGHQETDGLQGIFIVRDPIDVLTSKYDYDLPEHHMLIFDWYEKSGESLAADHATISLNSDGFGYLINGLGGVERYIDKTGHPIYTPSQVFRVQSGKRYRFRIIFNAAIDCPVQLSIDSHVLDILALDGRPIQSMEHVDSILLSGGERVDLVPYPRKGIITIGNRYYIRVRGLNYCDDVNRGGIHQVAVLAYDHASVLQEGITSYTFGFRSGLIFNTPRNLPAAPDAQPIQGIPLINARDLMPIDPRYKQVPDKIFYVDVRYQGFSDDGNLVFAYPQMNNISFIPPKHVSLSENRNKKSNSYCSPESPTNCINGYCQCTQLISVDKDDLVEIVMFDPDGFEIGHPFHMHGYVFRVVALEAIEELLYPEKVRAMNEGGLIKKHVDGPLRDTFLLPGRGYAVIHVIADNPGYWFFHCHLTEHMAQGMSMLIKVGNSNETTPLPANFPACSHFQTSRSSRRALTNY